ncbi:MAG: acetate--CoA ligase family protein [Gammaproteobacteria bacterium]|nr:acetate--CoA ligase family protein [Gammaproteobacteria bacterium]MBU1441597.1 acetate--CoA ligase family protein [Gammaproteobacteria bacterium]
MLQTTAVDALPGQDTLARMFSPRSIAIIGASSAMHKIGAVPLAHLVRHGYRGKIFPVNPNAGEILGLRAYPDVKSIGEPVDLVVVAVPAAVAGAAVEEAAAAGARSAVIFTSGYAEIGPEGARAQEQLAEIARRYGMPILGPNCLGFMNVRERLYATFSPVPFAGLVEAGNVGMVSQSGAFAAYAYSLARERGVPLSYWISTGNQCSVDVAACIEWLADDPHTSVIMAYLEGCRDGEALKRALSRAREAGKPVVVTKVGRTDSGARAAASHTAALAGNDAIYDALFRQYDAIRALTIDDFFNFGHALSVLGRRPAGQRLGVLTVSGGVGALMADAAEESGLSLPELPPEAQDAIVERVPFAGPKNPVDVTGQVTTEPDLLDFAGELMGRSGCYDSLVVFLAAAGLSDTLWPQFLDRIMRTRQRVPEIVMAICTLMPPDQRKPLEDAGVLVFDDPTAAIRTLGAISRPPAPSAVCNAAPPDVGLLAAIQRTSEFTEAQALGLLRQAGFPVVDHVSCDSADDACRALEKFGGPVVVKLQSPDVLHKSDIGGVKLGLRTPEEVRRAFEEIVTSARTHAPDARIEGALVAPMVRDGVECILGLHIDPVFGPVVMVGLGGVMVEVLRDVSFRLAPFDHATAHEMIASLKGKDLLHGARGRPKADVSALADALVRLSQIGAAAQEHVRSIEINPFLVLAEGLGAVAVDAVIECAEQETKP